MVTEPILRTEKDFKRLTIWESFAAIWGTILPPGLREGGSKMG